MGMSFDSVNASIATVVSNAENTLKTRIASLDPATVSPTDLLLLQQEVSKWTMMNEIQSTVVKQLSDTMKGIIQKSG
ncbi:MAG: type secretion protein [Proteobacteria bacterium]|nr:type secretion protein [Pseudomonadota bacterium]